MRAAEVLKSIAPALLAALFLGGCGISPVPDYYLLTDNTELLTELTSGVTVGVGPVDVAEYLERPQLVSSDGTNRLELDEQSRWAEPLDRAVIRITALNLAKLLGTEKVTIFPWRRDDEPQIAVRITVVSLDHRQGLAVLGARWVVVDIASDKLVFQALRRYDQPSGSAPEALVGAYSDLFARLAADVVAAIRTVGASDRASG